MKGEDERGGGVKGRCVRGGGGRWWEGKGRGWQRGVVSKMRRGDGRGRVDDGRGVQLAR